MVSSIFFVRLQKNIANIILINALVTLDSFRHNTTIKILKNISIKRHFDKKIIFFKKLLLHFKIFLFQIICGIGHKLRFSIDFQLCVNISSVTRAYKGFSLLPWQILQLLLVLKKYQPNWHQIYLILVLKVDICFWVKVRSSGWRTSLTIERSLVRISSHPTLVGKGVNTMAGLFMFLILVHLQN